MQIHGLNKTTLLDYPGIVASTIFTGCCNFRCPFCQNSDLVLDPSSQPVINEEEVISHLVKRKGIVQGVCITGGEPTIQKDLKSFIIRLKDLGLKVKLDTNGYNPEVIEELLELNLLDYIAMDIKSSLNDYSRAAGIDIDTTVIQRSVNLIMNSGIDYEFRTTVVRQLHDKETFIEIGNLINGCEKYFLQGFVDSERVLMQGLSSYSKIEMDEFANTLKGYVKNIEVRGVD